MSGLPESRSDGHGDAVSGGPALDSGRRTPPPPPPPRSDGDAFPRTPTQRWGGSGLSICTTPRTPSLASRAHDGSSRRRDGGPTCYFSASPTRRRHAPKVDRFIPDRSSGLSMAGRYELHQTSRKRRKSEEEEDDVDDLDDGSHAYLGQAIVDSGCLLPSSCTPKRLFAPETFMSPARKSVPRDELGDLLASPFGKSNRVTLQYPRIQRRITKSAFKVLEAPGLRSDFYSHLVDWGPNRPSPDDSFLAVGLQSTIHLWSSASARVVLLCDLGQSEMVTAISWMERGTHIALGTQSGSVQIWDVNCQRRVRTMSGHNLRVGCLAWNDSTLMSGSRDCTILQRDVREPRQFTAQLARHRGEVCGLKRRAGKLASGGNDDRLMVWDERQTQQPLWRVRAHTSAVRAIDWSPHQANILATGGGRSDRHVKIWNAQTRKLLASRDTKSQVCDLVWSRNSNEIVSVHGFTSNQVVLWKAPKLQQIATLAGHNDKVLYLSMSPDGEMIVTGSGDETLHFWQVFPPAKQAPKEIGIAGTPSMIR